MKSTEHKMSAGSGPSCIYLLGLVGSSVYFISTATSFWGGVAGFSKALVWPAFLVFEGFKQLGV